jgi:hypothetical protein
VFVAQAANNRTPPQSRRPGGAASRQRALARCDTRTRRDTPWWSFSTAQRKGDTPPATLSKALSRPCLVYPLASLDVAGQWPVSRAAASPNEVVAGYLLSIKSVARLAAAVKACASQHRHVVRHRAYATDSVPSGRAHCELGSKQRPGRHATDHRSRDSDEQRSHVLFWWPACRLHRCTGQTGHTSLGRQCVAACCLWRPGRTPSCCLLCVPPARGLLGLLHLRQCRGPSLAWILLPGPLPPGSVA